MYAVILKQNARSNCFCSVADPPTQPVSGGRGTAPALGAPASGPAVAGKEDALFYPQWIRLTNVGAGPGSNFFSLPNPPPVPPPVMGNKECFFLSFPLCHIFVGGYGQVAYYPSMDPAMHGSRAADGPPQARK